MEGKLTPSLILTVHLRPLGIFTAYDANEHAKIQKKLQLSSSTMGTLPQNSQVQDTRL